MARFGVYTKNSNRTNGRRGFSVGKVSVAVVAIATFVVFVALIILAVLAFRLHPFSPLQPSQQEELFILQGVRLLEIVPTDYPPAFDFGKGKFINFDLSVPFGKDFRIERLIVSKEGVTDEEVSEAWLRWNAVRIFTTARFENNRAIFTAFPPIIEFKTWDLDPEAVFKQVASLGVSHELLENISEKQLVLRPLTPLPQLLPSDSSVTFGIYGKLNEDIAPRPKENGIRFCVEEISGTLVSEDGTEQKAKTSLTSLCGPFFGIRLQ